MKRILSLTAAAIAMAVVSNANAANPRVIHYMHCQERGAPMFDAIAVNLDYQYAPGKKEGQLVASIYHRVESSTDLIAQYGVTERQARRPGAPKEFLGKDFYMEVQTTVAGGKNGYPGNVDFRTGNLQAKLALNCYLTR